MQATKPAKELNLSDEKDFNELGEFFKLNLKDKEFNEIYDKAAAAAQRLGVKVKFDESAGRSHFVLNDNTITIAAANKEHFQAQDLLHELIHATTRKALKDFNENPAKAAQSYTKRQIEAINEINSLYLKSKGIAKRQGKDAYALQNVDEFVAELSSSEFRAFLKAQDIFERFIKALIRFFTGDSERLAKNVNSYKALKESYYKILDDYEPPLAPQKIADEKALKSVDELNLSENLGKSQVKASEKELENLLETLKEFENAVTHANRNLDYVQGNKEILIKENKDFSKYTSASEAEKAHGEGGFQTWNEAVRDFEINLKEKEHSINQAKLRLEKAQNELKRKRTQIRQIIEQSTNTTPLKEFGTNYAEFYRDGQGAVKKLLAEKQGQVAGAFYRQDLGDIDLVWGNDEIGLKKIIDKHLSDFADFKGDTAQDKLANALGEIVKDGKLINDKGVNTLYFSQGEKVYLVGLSEGFNGVGNNKWIITSYKVENIKPHIKEQIGSANKTLSADESLKEPQAFGSTADTNEIIPKTANESQGKANSMLESKKAYDSELKRLNNELEYTETLLRQVKDRGMIDNLNKIHDEILAQKRELLKQDPFKFEKVSHEVSHINQNNAIMSEISHKGGQDGTSNASNGLNAAEKGMPTSEPAGISDGLFSQKQLLDEPRGAGADLSNSPTHRQQPQTLFSQGASEPNASGGQQRGSNERLRTASGDLRGEVSGDGQNLRAEKGHNVSERFKQDRSEQHSRAKHTIRANSSSGTSHSNATATQELVSDTNAAGILSPAEKATIENQKFTQTIDPAKFNANEILSANINALKVLDELLITRNLATKEQKELLSAFSGAGGRFSDELNKIRKANPNDERLAYINGLLKQINEKLPKASGEIVDKGLSITDFYARSGDAYFTPTHIIKSMSDLAKKWG